MAHKLDRAEVDTRAHTPARWPLFWALLGLVAALPLLWLLLDPTPGADGSPPATVVVREGEGWTEVTQRLREQGILRRTLVFKGIVLLSGARSDLLPGRYQIQRGTSARDIIGALTNPNGQSVLTVPEGWRVEQIGERMLAQGLTTAEQWTAALDAPPANPVLASRPPAAGLEGYLYPRTYRFTEQDAAGQLVNEGVRSLEEQLTPALLAGFDKQGLTIHEALTLASIVEREARVAAERPVIASVYLNRLAKGMRLQADPTVQYAVGKPGDWWKAELTRSDLRDPSPYNTYVHEGLPPGPIASPGLASIEAVARPASTNYLYFVARGDGSHAFAQTYEEHERNVQRYRRP